MSKTILIAQLDKCYENSQLMRITSATRAFVVFMLDLAKLVLVASAQTQ